MHQASEDTESAAKNAYHGSATALDDTRITTEVKTDLAAATDLRSGQIHVTATAGVVTLRGTVHDSAVASRAEAIARNASVVGGVKEPSASAFFSSQRLGKEGVRAGLNDCGRPAIRGPLRTNMRSMIEQE